MKSPDIYESELNIPEKSKKAGLLVALIGIILLAIAIGIGIKTSKELKERTAKEWESAPLTDKTTTSAKQPPAILAKVFLLWAITTLLIVTLFILFAILAHRLATRLKGQYYKDRRRPTSYLSDAWTEAGRKFSLSEQKPNLYTEDNNSNNTGNNNN